MKILWLLRKFKTLPFDRKMQFLQFDYFYRENCLVTEKFTFLVDLRSKFQFCDVVGLYSLLAVMILKSTTTKEFISFRVAKQVVPLPIFLDHGLKSTKWIPRHVFKLNSRWPTYAWSLDLIGGERKGSVCGDQFENFSKGWKMNIKINGIETNEPKLINQAVLLRWLLV